MANQKNYKYVIELDTPIWPRKLADQLLDTALAERVVSVTDMQNDGHIYGATYTTRGEEDERRPVFSGFGFIPALRV